LYTREGAIARVQSVPAITEAVPTHSLAERDPTQGLWIPVCKRSVI